MDRMKEERFSPPLHLHEREKRSRWRMSDPTSLAKSKRKTEGTIWREVKSKERVWIWIWMSDRNGVI